MSLYQDHEGSHRRPRATPEHAPTRERDERFPTCEHDACDVHYRETGSAACIDVARDRA